MRYAPQAPVAETVGVEFKACFHELRVDVKVPHREDRTILCLTIYVSERRTDGCASYLIEKNARKLHVDRDKHTVFQIDALRDADAHAQDEIRRTEQHLLAVDVRAHAAGLENSNPSTAGRLMGCPGRLAANAS